MAVDLSLFNNSVSTLLDHLTRHYGEDAKLETYVICARVRSATIPGGNGDQLDSESWRRGTRRRSAA